MFSLVIFTSPAISEAIGVDPSPAFVRKATELAEPGDAVVLSPACSSYDMFASFEERGMAFRDAVGAVGARRLD